MVFCWLFAVLTFITKYDTGTGVYTLFMGFLMMPFETTVLDCVGPIFSCKTFFNETCKFNQPIVRCVLYTLMAIGTFAIAVTPCVAAGILLLVTAILLSFAQCNKMQDEADEARAGGRNGSLSKPLGESAI
jgi:hypothetical protein